MQPPIIREEIDASAPPALYPSEGYQRYTPARPDRDAVIALAELIDGAASPVIVAGNGVMTANAGVVLQALPESAGIAVSG